MIPPFVAERSRVQVTHVHGDRGDGRRNLRGCEPLMRLHMAAPATRIAMYIIPPTGSKRILMQSEIINKRHGPRQSRVKVATNYYAHRRPDGKRCVREKIRLLHLQQVVTALRSVGRAWKIITLRARREGPEAERNCASPSRGSREPT